MKANNEEMRLSMEVKDKRSTIEPLIMEIEAVDRLVKLRHDWLNKTENKLRSTYQAIAEDTRKIEIRLQELRREYYQETGREFTNLKK